LETNTIMKKFFALSITSLLAVCSFGQNTQDSTSQDNSKIPSKWKAADMTNRSNDHFMIQYGRDNWSGTNDSTSPSGFSRHFNIYFMLDKPFKTSPKFSVGLGLGLGSSNMFFERKSVNITSASTRLPFTNLDSANHFKKYKLTTVFLEAPIELRYTYNPLNSGKSFKMALGLKVGTMIDAHTKGKTLEDKNGTTVNDYIEKQKNRRFFNSTRLAVTGRVGYGLLSLYGAFQITSLLKEGAGPVINPYSIGISISGL